MQCGPRPIRTPGSAARFPALESALRGHSIRGLASLSILRICRAGEIFRSPPRFQKSIACRFESTMTEMRQRWRKPCGVRVAAFAMSSAPRSARALELVSYSMAAFIMAAPARPRRVVTIPSTIAAHVADAASWAASKLWHPARRLPTGLPKKSRSKAATQGCNQVVAQPQPPMIVVGGGFGAFPNGLPYTGNSNYLEITDTTQNWSAGYAGDLCTVAISGWAGDMIELVPNVNQSGVCPLAAGDQLTVTVWNPQSMVNATFTVTVASN